jgi:tRNA-specific 2-thiouridylase
MSGGVDSSVAGALLLEQGHEVIGVTMKLWGGSSDTGCCSVSDVDDARRVAQQLGVDHHVFNFGDGFTQHVVEPYIEAHATGITPNPCIECNRHLKFSALLERADTLGFDAVATGHHARIEQRGSSWHLCRGADADKDQSYVVHMLDQEAMSRTMFPVGDITKTRVREMAAALGLRTASKPDSQDVCFITSDGGRKTFLGDRIEFRPARVRDREGRDLGSVDAVELVTIGQRRGLTLAGAPSRRFVLDVDVEAGEVIVGSADDLLRETEHVEGLTWSNGPVSGDVLVQCSAHGEPQRATVEPHGSSFLVRWETSQRRIAPGQSAVFYTLDNREVIGGGRIAR